MAGVDAGVEPSDMDCLGAMLGVFTSVEVELFAQLCVNCPYVAGRVFPPCDVGPLHGVD
jgi:hypothetical protein